MLVKLTSNMAGPDGAWAAGARVDLDRETARALIEGGYATAIGAAARETAERPANSETATDSPAETATAAKPARPVKPVKSEG